MGQPLEEKKLASCDERSPPPTLVPNGVKVAVKQNMEGHEIW